MNDTTYTAAIFDKTLNELHVVDARGGFQQVFDKALETCHLCWEPGQQGYAMIERIYPRGIRETPGEIHYCIEAVYDFNVQAYLLTIKAAT